MSKIKICRLMMASLFHNEGVFSNFLYRDKLYDPRLIHFGLIPLLVEESKVEYALLFRRRHRKKYKPCLELCIKTAPDELKNYMFQELCQEGGDSRMLYLLSRYRRHLTNVTDGLLYHIACRGQVWVLKLLLELWPENKERCKDLPAPYKKKCLSNCGYGFGYEELVKIFTN